MPSINVSVMRGQPLSKRPVRNSKAPKKSDNVPLSSKLFYVLTNDRKHLGAVTMFYSGVLKGFRERLGCDFRIIPSSVHKVLLVPEHVDRTDADLRDILLDVNADAEVSEQELASHIYSYDPDTDEVEIVEVD